MQAARPALAQAGGLRRGAFGASLTLHGALAAAAILPVLVAAPLRPSAPPGLDVVWISPPEDHGAADDMRAPDAAPLPEQPPAEAVPGQPPDTPPRAAAEAMQQAAEATAATQPDPAHVPAPPEEPAPEPVPAPDVAQVIAAPEPPPRPAPPAMSAPPPPRAQQPPRPAAAPRPERAAPPAARPTATAARNGDAGAPAATASAAAITPASLPVAAPPGPILVTAPRYRSPPAPPVYPPRAVELGLAGTVLIRARIGAGGGTEEIRLWRTSGHALLDAAALAAVRRWAFEPASLDGRRVEAWVEVPVHFRLN